MRDAKLARTGTILRHEKPAREPRLDHMETRARGRLGELGHQHVKVAVQYPLQRWAGPEPPLECGSAHAQGRPASLHQGTKRRPLDPQYERHTEQPFVANQPDFETRRAIAGISSEM